MQGARRDRSEGEDVAKNISEKYRSLFAELKGLDISEILELFFEEVEENERTSEEVLISKRKVSYVEE